MNTELQVSLPQTLYEQVEQLAKVQNKKFEALLVEVLTEFMATNMPIESDTAEKEHEDMLIQSELDAYLTLYRELRQTHLDQYVAIYQSQLVDFDKELAVLYGRIQQQYPDEFVLIRRVENEPEPVYHFRSPRLVKGS